MTSGASLLSSVMLMQMQLLLMVVVMVVMMMMMIETESLMVHQACSIHRRLAFLAAVVSFKLIAHRGAVSDATEYSGIEGNDDEYWGYDRSDDDKRNVEGDVNVNHLRQNVAVRQLTTRPTPVHDTDSEGRESSKGEAGDGLCENDSTSV